jgi:hypothetical protein
MRAKAKPDELAHLGGKRFAQGVHLAFIASPHRLNLHLRCLTGSVRLRVSRDVSHGSRDEREDAADQTPRSVSQLVESQVGGPTALGGARIATAWRTPAGKNRLRSDMVSDAWRIQCSAR